MGENSECGATKEVRDMAVRERDKENDARGQRRFVPRSDDKPKPQPDGCADEDNRDGGCNGLGELRLAEVCVE